MKPPVIDAVRVPPSACNTSQSIRICRSPSASISVIARKERPISLCISKVRPLCFPRDASLSILVLVDRGNIPYSAVTQPLPLFLRNEGTRSSTLAVQRTCVSPNFTKHEPSAYFVVLSSNVTDRSWSKLRPEGLFLCAFIFIFQQLESATYPLLKKRSSLVNKELVIQ